MAQQDYKFEGWLGKGPESAQGKMEWGEFPKVKPFEETDVDIQVRWSVYYLSTLSSHVD
jgi:alcohol dehydrogenase (NADP+)